MRLIAMKALVLPALAIALLAGRSASLQVSNEYYGIPGESGGGSESYLGVDTRDVTHDRVATLQLKEESGVEVTMVDRDAPAGKAGVKEHDVILSVNGSPVESVEQLRRMIHEIPEGRFVSLGISRNGQPLTIKAQLAARKKGFAMAWPQGENYKFVMPAIPPVPPMPEIDAPISIVVVHSSTRSGLMVENLTSQLGDFFGVKDGQGVLVRSVERGSRAEKAGFHAGDVIVRINGEKIGDSGDFTHAVNLRQKDTATVTVLRDRKEVTLTLTLPERGPSGGLMGSSASPTSKMQLGPEIGRMVDAETQSMIASVRPELQHLQEEIACQSAAIAESQKEAMKLRTAEIRRIQPEIFNSKEWQEELKDFRKKMEDEGIEMRDQIRRQLEGGAQI